MQDVWYQQENSIDDDSEANLPSVGLGRQNLGWGYQCRVGQFLSGWGYNPVPNYVCVSCDLLSHGFSCLGHAHLSARLDAAAHLRHMLRFEDLILP